MLLTGSRIIRQFVQRHPDARRALDAWARLIEAHEFRNFAELRNTFGSADIVGERIIFDIRGNRYRLIAGLIHATQTCHVQSILTHAEYDRRRWMKPHAVKEVALAAWHDPHPVVVPPIFNEADYDIALDLIDGLISRGAANDLHPENAALSRILLAMYAYEKIHHPWPDHGQHLG
ncbi:type II toxin-antitoxin system HigB family toxin [Luteibacter aegosomatissinici]|uniref:type II toxin-antitoxin system HigB family toxin n=1 Tax=Luteibacter aegosomatissinici TaxID=2911539 RepID=UPI001FFAE07A|nr:type II toxin-antitoxin system HigB family toxin [Luteibacter aegosomatissinici]UPG96071.1 type II toxin-antitoxin system HigB family toxin [Luteibacter aegosomatissinici]